MIPLPDWAPNVHPIIVHFPVALLAVSPILDLAAISVKRWSVVRTTSDVLYVLGAVCALAAYFTGRAAAEGLILPAEAETTLTDHADWALRTVWFFGIYAVVRVAAHVWRGRVRASRRLLTDAGLLLLGASGLLLLVQTGDRGGRMVFEFGVGVQAAEQAIRSIPRGESSDDSITSDLVSSLQYLQGSAKNGDENPQSDMEFRVNDDTVFAVLPDTHRSLQAELQIYSERLEGRLQFVHHVQSTDTFGFVSIESDNLRLGRMSNGEEKVFAVATDVGIMDGSTIRVVADRDHVRVYLDGQLILHEHAEPLPAGPLGFRIVGNGSVLIRDLSVTELRE